MNPIRRLWSRRRAAAGAVAWWSGAAGLYAAMARPQGAIVLMYHSVAAEPAAAFVAPDNRIAPAAFARQMRFLAAHRRVVPFGELVAAMERGQAIPAGTVCITFDDGYLDNLTVAAPILQALALPATLFLATGHVSRTEPQWADVLHATLARRTRDTLALPAIGLPEVGLGTAAGRAAAWRALHPHLLQGTHTGRQALLAELREQLRPTGEAPRLTMDWDEARQLLRQHPRFELGGHTRDHIDLRTHGEPLRRAEVAGCADDLRRELGITPQWFSFPYGRWTPEAQRAVRDAGFRAAVGTGTRLRLDAHSDRFALPRVESPASMTALRFGTSAANPGILAWLGGA